MVDGISAELARVVDAATQPGEGFGVELGR